MSNVSGLNVWVFIWMCNILDAVLECNTFATSACWNALSFLHQSSCNYTTGYCSFQYNCSLWIRLTHQEPLILALESAHTHELPPSTHSHWDLKTHSAEAASLQGLETGTERVLCSCALCRHRVSGLKTPVATLCENRLYLIWPKEVAGARYMYWKTAIPALITSSLV